MNRRIRGLVRRRMLMEMLGGLSQEDRRALLQHGGDEDREEILQALQRQSQQIADVGRKVSSGRAWLSDLSSNIAGNAVWDGLVWLGSRILRKL